MYSAQCTYDVVKYSSSEKVYLSASLGGFLRVMVVKE